MVPQWSKRVAGAVVALGLVGCATVQRRSSSEEWPNRLVLALDGVDYRDVEAARARGLFADFHPPGRLISTFPSISDVAWHAIFGLQPPPGYQRVYYSARHNAVLGDALDAIRPIEYERRMDIAFNAKFHHLGAYLISWPITRREVDTDIARFLRVRGRRTVYAYNVGPDALQHTRGDIHRYLAYLDGRVKALRADHRQRTGRDLEVVVLSDHGHNRATQAAFLPMAEALRAHGFRASQALRDPADVVFSVDGVTTGFGVFCHPDSVDRLAAIVAAMPGVDIVSVNLGGDRFRVQSGRGQAEITRQRATSGDRVRYVDLGGDPLQLSPTLQRMAQAGALDADGYADAEAWLRFTATAPYPAAVVRIVHGHTDATRNPAPLLVSLDDRYRVGLGAVSVANRLRPLGGTHGALSATNALGVVMATFQDTPDDLATRVRAQFGGFDDLLEPDARQPAFDIVSRADLQGDRFRAFAAVAPSSDAVAMIGRAAADSLVAAQPVAVLRLPPAQRAWAGDSARVRVDISARDRTNGDVPLASASVALARWSPGADAQHFLLPLDSLRIPPLPPGEAFTVRLVLDRVRLRGGTQRVTGSRRILSKPMRTAADGVLWSY
jgi:hypothetical protein